MLILVAPMYSFSQVNVSEYIPRVVDGSPKTLLKYKWPYIHHIPPSIGLVIGYEGFKTNYYQIGLAANFLRDYNMEIGGMAGGQLLYKRDFRDQIQSFEAEIGWYTFMNIGLNFNYHVSGDNSTFGVKPFIGFSAFNLQLNWGYNIYSNKKNEIAGLGHSNWELKYVIPIIPFKGKEPIYIRDYYHSNYNHNSQYYSHGKYNYGEFGYDEYIRSDIQLR